MSLVTVLKHASRLNNAAELLRDLQLVGVPVLVIDDESDQAGLNTNARKNLLTGTADESGTYEAIVALRSALPHNSYLQYTATPQANLLLSAADSLDPSFAKVISSGSGYTGGRVFFQDQRDRLVVQVADSEVFDPKNPFIEPPPMLQESLRVFLLGIASGAGDGHANRSMMVQAHQNTGPHKLFYTWITMLLSAWVAGLSGTEQARAEVLHEFEPAYAELSKTVKSLQPLSALLDVLPEKIAEVRVVIVNSTKDAEKQIKWNQWFYWILIGGQKLDRGFTVEGLTVTYMPRQVSGNADVLQQRARFFGYRSQYIDYCRVYLIRDAIQAFVGYVDDEEFLRTSLKKHEGRPLMDWKRDFIMHQQFSRPTRSNVVGRRGRRLPLNKGWAWPKSMHLNPDVVAHNRAEFRSLFARWKDGLQDSTVLQGVVDRRASGPRNLVLRDLPLAEALVFLMNIRYAAIEDSLLSNAFELALGRLIAKHPGSKASIVFMGELMPGSAKGRQLSVLRDNIHTGMNPKNATGADVFYSGDRSIIADDQLTIQLRMVNLSDATPDGKPWDEVPWIAVHLPKSIPNDAWLEID